MAIAYFNSAAMSEQPRIIGRSQLHSSIELLQKHRSKVAATSTLLLLTTVFLVPIYLVFNQRQHSLHLTSLFSSHECVHDDGRAETRICRFDNLILHRSQLLYIYSGKVPELPDIMTNWHHNLHLDLVALPASDISSDTLSAEVQQVATATLTHRQWHLNYYHSMAESIFEVYNLACTYFELCNLHTKEVMVPVFLDKPGVAGWDTRLGDTEGGWRSVLPPAAEALQCFYPKPALWIADPMLHDKVVLLRRAVAGIGPYNRKWPGPPETANRFRSVYTSVDTNLTSQYRNGLVKCLGIQPARFDPKGPYRATIVNREYHAGRHIVNTEDIAREINALEEVSNCTVAQPEDLTFRQQMAVFAESQVIIMTHGAALGNVLFMSPGSVAVFYNWLKIGGAPHTWVTDVIQDFDLPINFVGMSTEDRRFIYPQKERYIFQPEYGSLPADEKRALLEEGICPASAHLQGCDDLKMNFAMDWNLLQPALTTAFANMQGKHSHILDGSDSI